MVHDVLYDILSGFAIERSLWLQPIRRSEAHNWLLHDGTRITRIVEGRIAKG